MRKEEAGEDQKSRSGEIAGTLATSVYDRLRSDILAGTLPPSERLRVEFLRTRYGVGTSPVREALNRLSTDGFVVQEDQKGFRVAAVSREDLSEVTKTRCWIEEVAVRQSIANGDLEWEEGIVLALHRMSRVPHSASTETYVANPEWERLHRAYHRALIAACESKLLIDFCEQLADQAIRYCQLATEMIYPRHSELDEHRSIMEKVIARDADSAVAMLQAHYRRTEETIVESMPVLMNSAK